MLDSANNKNYLALLREQSIKEYKSYSRFSEYLEYKAREKATPVHGQFELTPLCNFSCRMCYVHLSPDQMFGRPLLTVEEWKHLIREAWEAGMIQATLTGGECLTYPGFDELYLYLHSLGCEVDILTNGSLLNEERIRFFREHPPASIQITLYGSNDDTYEAVTGSRACNKVIENIRRAIEVDLSVMLSLTPCSYLGEDALDTLRLAYSLCNRVFINSMLFTPHKETGRTGDNAESDVGLYTRLFQLNRELQGLKSLPKYQGNLPEPGGPNHECTSLGLQCGGGRSCFVINWKGEMLPCNRLDMITEHPLEDDFISAWVRINKQAEAWPRVPECEGCVYESVCSHCAANILQSSEPGKRPDNLCKRTMYFVRHGVRELPGCKE